MSESPTSSSEYDLIFLRQKEVDEYNKSIEMYKLISNSLPSEWPPHLIQFKGRSDLHAAISEIENLDDVELVSNLWAHDQAQASIRANIVERSKAQAILNVLLSQQ